CRARPRPAARWPSPSPAPRPPASPSSPSSPTRCARRWCRRPRTGWARASLPPATGSVRREIDVRTFRSLVAALAVLVVACAPPPGNGSRVAWRWTAPPPAGVGMPAADRTGTAVTAGATFLVAFDVDGRHRWSTRRVGLRDVAPAFAPALVLAATDDGLVAADRTTGTIRWDAALGDEASTPVVAGGLAITSL